MGAQNTEWLPGLQSAKCFLLTLEASQESGKVPWPLWPVALPRIYTRALRMSPRGYRLAPRPLGQGRTERQHKFTGLVLELSADLGCLRSKLI